MLVCGEQGNIESHIPRKGILYTLNQEEPALNFLGLPVHQTACLYSTTIWRLTQTQVLRNLDTTLPLMSNDLPNMPHDIHQKEIQYIEP